MVIRPFRAPWCGHRACGASLAPGDAGPQAPGRLRFFRQDWVRPALAAGTGVLWALSFPLPGIAGFAWAVPGLLLALTSGQGAGPAFRTAYLAGAVHYLVSLSWLRHIPFPAGAFAAWFALALFLALLPPLWVWTCWRFARRLGLAGGGPHPWKASADLLAASSWLRLNAWFLLCTASWVASEMLLARFCGGFPWNLLRASQHRGLHGARPHPSHLLRPHQPARLEHREVLHDSGQRHVDRARQLGHRGRPPRQPLHDVSACRVG